MDDPQDLQIGGGLREGRPDAWNALYEAYFDRVWRCVARLMGPHAADVGDVVQETFLACARSARSYDPAKGSLWVWISGIARHHAATHFRARKRIDRLGPGGDLAMAAGRRASEWLEGRDQAPDQWLASTEAAALVRSTLAELPDEYTALLTAKYCDGASVDQIAQERQSSGEAVRSKLARARRAFREAFSRLAGGPPCAQDGPAGACHEP